METIFPEGDGFAGFFTIGFRKDPDQAEETQRVGTVILKRTYDIGPDAGSDPRVLTPASEALSVYTEDTPDNWLVNSDFELSETFEADGASTKPGGWSEENGATATRAAEGVSDMALRIGGTDVDGRVVQEVALRTPLKNRRFRFSFSAKVDVEPARIEGAQLEANGHTLCSMQRNLSTGMTRYSATDVWPADLELTDVKVVLPIAFDPDNPTDTRVVYYDRVQLEERQRLSEWDAIAVLKTEHDLAPYKEEADVIVLDYPASQGAVYVDGTTWLADNVMSGEQKALFGWEPRVGTSRETEAGTFSTNADDYPPEWPVPGDKPNKDPLPSNFQNAFYSGRLRGAHVAHSEPFLLTSNVIEIERDGTIDYAFQLHGETVSAAYSYYRGTGTDDELYWRTQDVVLNLDTLVIEPEIDRCCAVWRGVWDFDGHADDAYRRLVVSVAEP